MLLKYSWFVLNMKYTLKLLHLMIEYSVIIPWHAIIHGHELIVGRSYKNEEFDWSFIFHDCVMRVTEIIINISFTGPSDHPKQNLALPISKLLWDLACAVDTSLLGGEGKYPRKFMRLRHFQHSNNILWDRPQKSKRTQSSKNIWKQYLFLVFIECSCSFSLRFSQKNLERVLLCLAFLHQRWGFHIDWNKIKLLLNNSVLPWIAKTILAFTK